MEKKLIAIGIIYSLTGATSVTEKGQCEATLQAIKEYNLQSSELELVPIIKDIASNPQRAVQEVTDLLEKDIKILIGTYTSACRKAIQPLLVQYDALLFYPAQYEGGEQHPNIIYSGVVPNQQLGESLPWLMQQHGKRIFIVGSSYDYSRQLSKAISQIVARENGSIVGASYIELGDEYFIPLLQSIEKANPDLILTTVVGESALAFYRTYFESGLNYPLVTTIVGEREMNAIGISTDVSCYAVFPYFSTIENEENRHFIEQMKNKIPDGIMSSSSQTAFLSVQLLTYALENCRELTVQLLKKALHHLELSTPEGKIFYDAKTQHLARHIRIGKWESKGCFDVIHISKEIIQPEPFYFEEEQQLFLNSLSQKIEHVLDSYEVPYLLFSGTGYVLSNKFKVNTANIWGNGYLYNQILIQESHVEMIDNNAYFIIPLWKEKQLMMVCCIQCEDTSSAVQQLVIRSMETVLKGILNEVIGRQNTWLYAQVLQGVSSYIEESVLVFHGQKIIYRNDLAKQLQLAKGPTFNELITSVLFQQDEKSIHTFRSGEMYESKRLERDGFTYIYLREVYRPKEIEYRGNDAGFDQLIGKDVRFLKVVKAAEALANLEGHILLKGAHGVGKEEVARAIHQASPRAQKPFITINCSMIISIFFEYEFSKSNPYNSSIESLFENLQGGTLYLDEVTELPISIQQQLAVYLTNENSKQFDIRLIISTEKEIEQELAYNGSVAPEFYSLIHQYELYIPSLTERKFDIPLLVDYFVEQLSRTLNRPKKLMSNEFVEALISYDWPGNVQELQSVLERAFYLADYESTLSIEHLPNHLLKYFMKYEHRNNRRSAIKDRQIQQIIQELLKQRGNISKTAQALGLSRTTLYRKLDEYNSGIEQD